MELGGRVVLGAKERREKKKEDEQHDVEAVIEMIENEV